MHGGAVTLAHRFPQGFRPDLILATDMLDLSLFLALTRKRSAGIPTAMYMHENQLTYPLPDDPKTGPMRRQLGERDLHYAFINYSSMLAADLVLFNSEFHRRSFLSALPAFLKHFPDFRETGSIEDIRKKSRVFPVGIDVDGLDAARPSIPSADSIPLVLWNQRWEYDKNPQEFFRLLIRAAERGVSFRLAVCGQAFQSQPQQMQTALRTLGERVMHQGYLEKGKYRELLWKADLTISTAIHEFFGISVMEAAACEVLPLLPDRLSYPELIPAEFHRECLYRDPEELLERLALILQSPQSYRDTAVRLAPRIRRFDWKNVAPMYDACLESLAETGA